MSQPKKLAILVGGGRAPVIITIGRSAHDCLIARQVSLESAARQLPTTC